MASPTLIPMLDPQGQTRMIPADQLDAAKKAGGKVARKFQAPDGTKRWIPADQTEVAVKAGGKPVPIEQESPKGPEGSGFGRFVSSALSPIKEAATGMYHTVVDHPKGTGEEIASLLPGGLQMKRAVLDPAIDQGKAAVGEFKQSAPTSMNPTGDQLSHRQKALGHGLATVLPMVGPWAANVGEKGGEQLGAGDYAGAAGTAAGNAAIALAPKVVGKVLPKAVRAATKTGPGELKSLVKDTQAGNSAGDAYSKVRSAIETAREKSKGVGNEKYNAVNDKLSSVPADREFIQNAFTNATEYLRGSHSDPTLLKDVERTLKTEGDISYSDLQGDYSRLGKELTKGTLDGDVYKAYDQLHEALGTEMQRIADAHDLGPQLSEARQYWRKMKQTFGKPIPQSDAATSTLKSLSPGMSEQDTIGNRIRLMGDFDPNIPTAFKGLDKAQEAAKGKPTPNPGEALKIGEEEIRAAKNRGADEGTERIRKGGKKIINYGIGLKALWDAYHLNLGSAAEDVGIGYAGYKTADAFAKLLERPDVRERLVRVTDEDIAQIPPELRGPGLKPLLDAAKKKGVVVDPKLYAVAGATAPKKSIGDILKP